MVVLPGRLANAVSADGSVVVGFNGQASRWTAQTGTVGLGDLPGGSNSSNALDVSGDGSLIVGYGETEIGREAMFWTQPTGMVNLRDFLISQGIDLTGWSPITAEGVSADGRTIVGTGENPAGNPEGWIATIPEPSTMVLAALAAAAVFALHIGKLRRKFARL
jgi:uncharacterized membrane protein